MIKVHISPHFVKNATLDLDNIFKKLIYIHISIAQHTIPKRGVFSGGTYGYVEIKKYNIRTFRIDLLDISLSSNCQISCQ